MSKTPWKGILPVMLFPATGFCSPFYALSPFKSVARLEELPLVFKNGHFQSTGLRSRPRERLHVHSLNEPANGGIDTTIVHMLYRTADGRNRPTPSTPCQSPTLEQAWLRAGLGLALQICWPIATSIMPEAKLL